MPFKKITLFITCLLLFPLSTLAQDGEKTYVIKKGDTLWGISQKFLQDPYYWPSLWSNNPFVTNPHLIYPGQKISIYNGQVEIVPVDALADAEEPIEPTIEPQESITIQVSEGASGFISQEDFESAGTLIDTEDNRLMMGTGETVFLDLGNLAATQPGELFSLYEIRDRIKHPLTEEYIGYHVDNLGTVQITAINAEVATGEIIKAYQEIQRGSKLQPYQPLQTVIELRQADKELDGILIDAQDNRLTLGQYDIVYLDLGLNDGLQVGNLLNISRPRDTSDLGINEEDLQLPEILLGSAVVIETRADTSTALVLKVLEPLYRGDHLTTVME